jgi:hypothetical protein
VNLIVVKVIPVNSLELVGQIFEYLLRHLREQGLPILFVIHVEHGEHKQIVSQGAVDEVSIEIRINKVSVKLLQFFATV